MTAAGEFMRRCGVLLSNTAMLEGNRQAIELMVKAKVETVTADDRARIEEARAGQLDELITRIALATGPDEVRQALAIVKLHEPEEAENSSA